MKTGELAIRGHYTRMVQVSESSPLSRYRKKIFLIIIKEVVMAGVQGLQSRGGHEVATGMYNAYRKVEPQGALPVVSILSRYMLNPTFRVNFDRYVVSYAELKGGTDKEAEELRNLCITGWVSLIKTEDEPKKYYDNLAKETAEEVPKTTEITVLLHELLPFLMQVRGKSFKELSVATVNRRMTEFMRFLGITRYKGLLVPAGEQRDAIKNGEHVYLQKDAEDLQRMCVLFSIDKEYAKKVVQQIQESISQDGESYVEYKMRVVRETLLSVTTHNDKENFIGFAESVGRGYMNITSLALQGEQEVEEEKQ